MFKYLLFALVLVALAVPESEGHIFKFKRNNKPRLDQKALEKLFLHEAIGTYGHFTQDKDSPLNDLYFKYVETFDPWFKNMNVRPHDHMVNYAPSVANCSELMGRTEDGTSELEYLYDVVLMDACLGIVNVTTGTKFTGQRGLKKRYDTRIWEWEEQDRQCVVDLFEGYYDLSKKFRSEPCRIEWLKLYNDFADCRTYTWKEGKDERYANDPYVEMIYQVVRKAATNCFAVTHGHMGTELVYLYESETGVRSGIARKRYFEKLFSEATRQSGRRAWPRSMMRVLQIVKDQEHVDQVDLIAVQTTLASVKQGRTLFAKKNLEQALTNYMTRKMTQYEKKTKEFNTEISRKAVWRNLCGRYSRIEDPSQYDFYSNMIELIRPTHHYEIFGITPDQFVIHILNDKIKALYFALFSCEIFDNTKVAETDGERRIKFNDRYLKKVMSWPMPSTNVYHPIPEDESESDYTSDEVDDEDSAQSMTNPTTF